MITSLITLRRAVTLVRWTSHVGRGGEREGQEGGGGGGVRSRVQRGGKGIGDLGGEGREGQGLRPSRN